MESIKIRISGNVRNVAPVMVGSGETAKVIASIGVTSSENEVSHEIEKARRAIEYGASMIIDHSLTSDAIDIQRRIAQAIDVPFSVIPAYNAASLLKYSDKKYFSSEDALTIIEDQAKLGADMITVHASVLREDIERIQKSKRTIPCTSRGGTMVMQNMIASGNENCYWEKFDDILSISKEYGLTISLGSIFRPASVVDDMEHDWLFWAEIERNAMLVKRARAADVQIMVEGIGHMSIGKIPDIVRRTKEACHGAPYRVLAVATDAALGFDHVSSAIAGAVAVANGADVITAVTRSEHIGLPSIDDVVEAVVSAKIAAHCGDIARLNDYGADIAMSEARAKVGCRGLVETAICPKMTAEALKRHKSEDSGKKCTMCGDFCALASLDIIKNRKDGE